MTSPNTAELRLAEPPAELGVEALRYPPIEIAFDTTEEVPLDGDWLGQERALAALEMGVTVRHVGYNIYVCGLTGAHREQDLAALLQRFTAQQPIPGDRVLVQNFRDTDRPRTLYLPAGWGNRLRDDMRELVDDLREALPKTFRDETFEEEKERLSEQFGSQGEEISNKLSEHATQAGFALQSGPEGQVIFVPLKEGRPMTPEELDALDDAGRNDIRRRQRELARELKSVWRQQQTLIRRLGRAVRDAERRTANEVITPLIEELSERYPHEGVRTYLDEVKTHMLDHLGAFQQQAPPPPVPPFMMGLIEEEGSLLDYAVNVLVDNSGRQGPPVIVETSPTYKNIFGAIERMVDRHGKLVTNFTRVHAGSILAAHGGCIIISVLDALAEPLVWRALRECLKSGQLEIEGYDPFALFATSSLKPERMAIDTRVVLTGPTEIFHLIYSFDEEFREIFKMRADFSDEVDAADTRNNFVAHVARLAKANKLPPFRATAVMLLMEHAARELGDRRKLPSQWTRLADTMREAAFWASKNAHPVVEGNDVRQALAQRTFRLNRIEAKIRELIQDKVLLVDVEGERVGQINGLAVLNLAGYEFGRPSRITAVVAMGTQGVVAVDREAKMSGRTYDKAVLIISGYLRHVYAQHFPLSLSASISFEQSYSGIDGDSASVAELLALISALSGVPLRQDIAVTGSVNQFGDVQPIGGVNEKVEGFFLTCKQLGALSHHGVMIPVGNVDHLIPASEVVDAVAAGAFHIYPVRTLDQALEILTGRKAGSVDEPGTIHHQAAERLRQLAEGVRRFATPVEPTTPQSTRD